MKFLGLLLAVMILSPNLAGAQENPCKNSCNQDCHQYKLRLTNELRNIEEKCGSNNPDPVIPGTGRVEIYKSDSCSGELIGRLTPGTNCSKYSNENAWGVKINGKCENIADMNAASACELYKGGSSSQSVLVYESDSCSGDLVAALDQSADCQVIAQKAKDNAWAVMIDGKCENITDTNAGVACEVYKGGGSPHAVYLYRSDSCSGDLIAAVNYTTDCSAAAKHVNGSIWGVKAAGDSCNNISDTNFLDACERYKD